MLALFFNRSIICKIASLQWPEFGLHRHDCTNVRFINSWLQSRQKHITLPYLIIPAQFKGHITLTRTIHANNSRSSFGLIIHTHANVNVRTNSSRRSLCQMQFMRTTCEWSQFSTNILHTDSGRSEVVSKIKTIRWPVQCTFLDFRNFAMHAFTNRCSSACNPWNKFQKSPYFSFV